MNNKTRILVTAALLGTALNLPNMVISQGYSMQNAGVPEQEIKDKILKLLPSTQPEVKAGGPINLNNFKKDFSNHSAIKELLKDPVFSEFEVDENALKVKVGEKKLPKTTQGDKNNFLKELQNDLLNALKDPAILKPIPEMLLTDTPDYKNIVQKVANKLKEQHNSVELGAHLSDIGGDANFLTTITNNVAVGEIMNKKKVADWRTILGTIEQQVNAVLADIETKSKNYIDLKAFEKKITDELAVEVDDSLTLGQLNASNSAGLENLASGLIFNTSNFGTELQRISQEFENKKADLIKQHALDQGNTAFGTVATTSLDQGFLDEKQNLIDKKKIAVYSSLKEYVNGEHVDLTALNSKVKKAERDFELKKITDAYANYINTVVKPAFVQMTRDNELESFKTKIASLLTSDNKRIAGKQGYNNFEAECDYDALIIVAKKGNLHEHLYDQMINWENDYAALTGAFKIVQDKLNEALLKEEGVKAIDTIKLQVNNSDIVFNGKKKYSEVKTATAFKDFDVLVGELGLNFSNASDIKVLEGMLKQVTDASEANLKAIREEYNEKFYNKLDAAVNAAKADDLSGKTFDLRAAKLGKPFSSADALLGGDVNVAKAMDSAVLKSTYKKAKDVTLVAEKRAIEDAYNASKLAKQELNDIYNEADKNTNPKLFSGFKGYRASKPKDNTLVGYLNFQDEFMFLLSDQLIQAKDALSQNGLNEASALFEGIIKTIEGSEDIDKVDELNSLMIQSFTKQSQSGSGSLNASQIIAEVEKLNPEELKKSVIFNKIVQEEVLKTSGMSQGGGIDPKELQLRDQKIVDLEQQLKLAQQSGVQQQINKKIDPLVLDEEEVKKIGIMNLGKKSSQESIGSAQSSPKNKSQQNLDISLQQQQQDEKEDLSKSQILNSQVQELESQLKVVLSKEVTRAYSQQQKEQEVREIQKKLELLSKNQ